MIFLKRLIVLFVLFSAVTNSSGQTTDQANIFSKTEYKEFLKDSLVITYKEKSRQQAEGFINGEFDLKSLNRDYISKNLKMTMTREEKIKVHKDAGMKNAEKFVNLTEDIIQAKLSILKKYPKLRTVSSQDFVNLINDN